VRDLRKDHDKAIREVCSLRRKLDLFSEASVAIDGSKFKAVNARDKNLTDLLSACRGRNFWTIFP